MSADEGPEGIRSGQTGHKGSLTVCVQLQKQSDLNMLETSSSLIRVVALSGFTALFAGTWSHDRPREALALKAQPPGNPLVRFMDEEIARRITSISLTIQAGGTDKFYEFDLGGLGISPAVAMQHLLQLPSDVGAGEYRIRNAAGGVGRLRVHMNGTHGTMAAEESILTTRVDNQTLQFESAAEIANLAGRTLGH